MKLDLIKIRIKMLENNLTMIEIANILDLNVNTVSRWLNGNHLNNIIKFLELLLVLNLEINDIIKKE